MERERERVAYLENLVAMTKRIDIKELTASLPTKSSPVFDLLKRAEALVESKEKLAGGRTTGAVTATPRKRKITEQKEVLPLHQQVLAHFKKRRGGE